MITYIVIVFVRDVAESVEAVAALAAVLRGNRRGDDVAVLVEEWLLVAAEDVDDVVVVAEVAEVALEGVDPLRRRLPKVVR